MRIEELPIWMIRCLTITIVVEVVVALLIGIRDKRDLRNIILVNIVTNLLVTSIPVYMDYRYGVVARNIALTILEVFALLYEGFIYIKFMQYRKINGFVISLILNGASYAIGEVMKYFEI